MISTRRSNLELIDGAYKPSNSIRGTAPHEFSDSPEKYISDRLREKINEAVSEYLAA